MTSSSEPNDAETEFELGPLDDLVRHHLWRARVVAPLTLESLRSRTYKLDHDADGLAIRRTSEPLYRETTSSTSIEFPPGITAAYLKVNGRARDEILTESNRFPQLMLEMESLRSYGFHDFQFLEMAGRRDRFLVRVDRRDVRFEVLVWQLVVAFPDSRFAIVVPRKGDIRRISRDLWRLGVRVSRASSSRNEDVLPRVSIGTSLDFVHVAHRLSGEDFLVVRNAIKGLGKQMLLPISSAFRARLIGFLPLEEKVAPNDWDLLYAVFGFDQVTILRHGIDGPPRVAMIRSRCGGQPMNANDIVATKRQLIWNGRQRNLLTRKVARAVAGVGPQDVLPPDCAAYINEMEPAKVAVLVDNREQAEALGRVLPHWPVIASAEDASALNASESFGVIVTLKAASSIGLVDVLIRADGGVGVPSCLAGYDLVPRLIIDFDDRQYAELRIRSRSRREAYRKLGWFDVGEDTYMARIDDFLATRPEVRDV